MPFRSRRFQSRGRSAQRRGMEWISGASTVVNLTTGSIGAGYVILPSQSRSYVNPTLVRTRGSLSFFHPTGTADCLAAVGIIPWSDRDDTLPADPPRPFSDPDLDWIWHQYILKPDQAGGWLFRIGLDTGPGVDTKAMRKLGADQGVLVVAELFAGASAEWSWGLRCLLKE